MIRLPSLRHATACTASTGKCPRPSSGSAFFGPSNKCCRSAGTGWGAAEEDGPVAMAVGSVNGSLAARAKS